MSKPLARPLVAVLGLVAVGALPSFLTASLAPEVERDFAFGAAALGVAVGAFYAVSSLASAPAGRVVARIGADAAVRLAVALALGCMLGVALLARSAPSLILLLLIGALSNAVATPTASAILTREVGPERQGIGYGALTAGAPVASLLAGLALPLVAQPLGWRVAFTAGAGLSLLAALAAGCGARRRRASGPAGCPTGTVAAPVRSGSSGPDEAGGPGDRGGWNAVHTLAVAAALASAGSTGLISFLVLFSIDSGLSGTEAGTLLATTGFAAAASRIGFGTVADRIAERARTHLLALLCFASLGFALLIVGTPLLIVAGALMAGGVGWGWPGLLNLVAVRAGCYAPAEAVGIVMSGVFLGALVGPLLVGLVADGFGFDAAWAIGGLFLLAAAGIVALAQSKG